MIRVEFFNVAAGPWAHEVTQNVRFATVLREHGVPLAGRLAFAGVERGQLSMVHDADRRTARFEFADVDESAADCATKFSETHSGNGYTVYMNSHQLAKFEEDEEL